MPPPNVRSQPPANAQTNPTAGLTGPPPQVGPQQAQPFGQIAGPPPAFVPMALNSQNGSPHQQYNPPIPGIGPPQLPTPQPSTPLYPQSATSMPTTSHNDLSTADLPPPSRPVFGLSLDDLLRRDGSAIPLVVYQCLQAVDLFGLDVEGIYRLSGSATHVAKLRAIFDNGERALHSCMKSPA
jgi:hypothetical protein